MSSTFNNIIKHLVRLSYLPKKNYNEHKRTVPKHKAFARVQHTPYQILSLEAASVRDEN